MTITAKIIPREVTYSIKFKDTLLIETYKGIIKTLWQKQTNLAIAMLIPIGALQHLQLYCWISIPTSFAILPTNSVI